MTTTDTHYILMANRLQALHRSLSGAGWSLRAPDVAQYPTNLPTANLPMALTWVGASSFSQKGGGWGYEVLKASVFLFIEPLGQNDIPSRAALAMDVMATLIDAYRTAENIPLAQPGDNTAAYQITLESDPGNTHSHGGLVADLGFGGASYYGARFSLNVTLQWA